MALYFCKRRRWPPSRPVQFILAFLALAVAILVLVAWLIIGYRQNAPTPTTEQESSSSTEQTETVTDLGRCLVILDVDSTQHFLLVQTDPAEPRITAVSIPANLTVGNSTLSATLKKHGSPQAVQAVSETLELPLTHYITLTADNIESFINQFENGITYTLPETVTYTDENGISASLSASEHTLTGGQVRGILQYDNWKKKANKSAVAADLLCALLDQYMTDGFPLRSYFGLLSNAAVTDLRIDNFNAYYSALAQIAQNNTGAVCRIEKLTGTTDNNKFSPDVKTFQKESALYR